MLPTPFAIRPVKVPVDFKKTASFVSSDVLPVKAVALGR
jgi:hypothetical protein